MRARSLIFLFALVLGSGCDEDLPEILVVRPFTLTDQTGQPFDSATLRGRVWIVSFLFTSCGSICPLLTTQVGNLQRRLSDVDVHFVSITVDPEIDTPDVLAAYAERHDADPRRWKFLTGPRESVRSVTVDVFHASMGEPDSRAPGYDIAHSGKLFLVDRQGVLRGLYETDREGLESIERDARRLAEPDD